MRARWMVGAAAVLSAAVPAWADGPAPRDPWTTPAPSAIHQAVTTYVATAQADPALLGTASSFAGYDRGFWIRSGDFSLGLTFLLQARYESYSWSDFDAEPAPGGDLSGFSLPRSVVLVHGSAPCSTRYAMLLEFGHHGGPFDNSNNAAAAPLLGTPPPGGPPNALREGWIEWGSTRAFNVRAGHIKLPSTRQLMAVAGIQQFVDVSLASSYIGHVGIGYQDRNRDYGVELWGNVGPCDRLNWSFAVSNGDGANRRNVLDGGTDDGLAYSGRLDWDFGPPKGYDEGAVRQRKGELVASLGAWAQYRAARSDKPHFAYGDVLVAGVDAAVGYGGFSSTLAFSYARQSDSDVGMTFDGMSWLVQAGYLFPGSAFEVAARWSAYVHDTDFAGKFGAQELAAAVNYYLDEHYDKITLDVAWIDATDGGNLLFDVMSGYSANAAAARGSDALMIRLQWQLVL